MTKLEYLNKLQEKLQKFSDDLQTEIMDDYMQHFAEGEQLGKSEEEIIAELGNIEDMIRDLPEDEVVERVAVSGWSGYSAGTKREGAVGGEVSQRSQNESSLAEMVEAESCKQNSYDGNYSEIVVDGSVATVTLTESVDGRIYVDYRNDGDLDCQMKYEFYQYEENGIFYTGVRRREGVSGSNRKTISFFGKTISFENVFERDSMADISLDVKVPTGMGKIVAKTGSGDLKVHALRAAATVFSTGSGEMTVRDVEVSNFKLNTGSGDVSLEKGRFESAMINTGSGEIDMNMVDTEKLNGNTASGDVCMKNVRAGSLKFNTASGDIDMNYVEAFSVGVNSASGDICGKQITVEDSISCTTASGNVDMEGSARSFKFGSASGDISMHCGGRLQSVSASTASGDVDLTLEGITGMEITTKAGSGDVEIEWQGQDSCVKNATSTFGDGSCKVQVKTGSGDISVVCR